MPIGDPRPDELQLDRPQSVIATPRPGVDEQVIDNWERLLRRYPAEDANAILSALADQRSRQSEQEWREFIQQQREDLEQAYERANQRAFDDVAEEGNYAGFKEDMRNLILDLSPEFRHDPIKTKALMQTYLANLIHSGRIRGYSDLRITRDPDDLGLMHVEVNIQPNFSLRYVNLRIELTDPEKNTVIMKIELPENELEDLILD
jgi:hypothetical protein